MTAVEHEAQVFAEGLRGGYIISQALFYGIRELEKIDPPLQEVSNLADMRFLRDNLYNLFMDIIIEVGTFKELTNEAN